MKCQYKSLEHPHRWSKESPHSFVVSSHEFKLFNFCNNYFKKCLKERMWHLLKQTTQFDWQTDWMIDWQTTGRTDKCWLSDLCDKSACKDVEIWHVWYKHHDPKLVHQRSVKWGQGQVTKSTILLPPPSAYLKQDTQGFS